MFSVHAAAFLGYLSLPTPTTLLLLAFSSYHSFRRYDMYLCVACVVSEHGKTEPAAYSWLQHQDKSSFVWFLEQIVAVVGLDVLQLLFTDQDPSIREAIIEIAARYELDLVHALCLWHLLCRNLPDNLKRYSKSESPSYRWSVALAFPLSLYLSECP